MREYSRRELDELFAYCGLAVAEFRTRRALRSGGPLARRVVRGIENLIPRWRDSLVYVLEAPSADRG